MRTRTVSILVAIQVVLAVALFAVAWTGQASRAALSRDLAETRADLGVTKAALAQARAETATANRRVEALSAACCRPGIDRAAVLVTVAPATRPAAPTPAARSARPSPATSARPSSHPPRSPSPRPSPTPTCTPLPLIGCRR